MVGKGCRNNIERGENDEHHTHEHLTGGGMRDGRWGRKIEKRKKKKKKEKEKENDEHLTWGGFPILRGNEV